MTNGSKSKSRFQDEPDANAGEAWLGSGFGLCCRRTTENCGSFDQGTAKDRQTVEAWYAAENANEDTEKVAVVCRRQKHDDGRDWAGSSTAGNRGTVNAGVRRHGASGEQAAAASQGRRCWGNCNRRNGTSQYKNGGRCRLLEKRACSETSSHLRKTTNCRDGGKSQQAE